MRGRRFLLLCAAAAFVPTAGEVPPPSTEVIKSCAKLSDTSGGFTGTLNNNDYLGKSVASLGDLDGDDVPALVVGAWRDDDGGDRRGAVWILFLDSDGSVKSHAKIADTSGGFTGTLGNNTKNGWSVASLGALDGDGVPDSINDAFR